MATPRDSLHLPSGRFILQAQRVFQSGARPRTRRSPELPKEAR